jgi:hypothetical protein
MEITVRPGQLLLPRRALVTAVPRGRRTDRLAAGLEAPRDLSTVSDLVTAAAQLTPPAPRRR